MAYGIRIAITVTARTYGLWQFNACDFR